MVELNPFKWGKTPRAPAPPDPKDQARATLGSNLFSAKANNAMQMMDQTGPFGSVRHFQTGSKKFTDPWTGFTAKVPTYGSHTAFNPQEKAAYDANAAARAAAGRGAMTAYGTWNGLQGKAFEGTGIGAGDIAARAGEIAPKSWNDLSSLNDDYMHRIEGDLSRMRGDVEAKLAAGGITRDSEAYDNEMRRMERQEVDAAIEAALRGRTATHNERMDRERLGLSARSMAFNELMGTRRQEHGEFTDRRDAPLRSFSALMGHSGFVRPDGQPIGPGGFRGADAAGLTQQRYSNEMGVYDRKMDSHNRAMDSLGDLIGDGFKTWAQLSGGKK